MNIRTQSHERSLQMLTMEFNPADITCVHRNY